MRDHLESAIAHMREAAKAAGGINLAPRACHPATRRAQIAAVSAMLAEAQRELDAAAEAKPKLEAV